MMNGKGQDVYRLPPPASCPLSTSGEPINLRIPQTEKATVTKVLYEMLISDSVYLYSNFRYYTSVTTSEIFILKFV